LGSLLDSHWPFGHYRTIPSDAPRCRLALNARENQPGTVSFNTTTRLNAQKSLRIAPIGKLRQHLDDPRNPFLGRHLAKHAIKTLVFRGASTSSRRNVRSWAQPEAAKAIVVSSRKHPTLLATQHCRQPHDRISVSAGQQEGSSSPTWAAPPLA
jgi:hypothetical protein